MIANLLSTLLFVSAATPARFDKALATDADIVCIDLEDAVAAEDKDVARAAAVAALGHSSRLALRINPVTTLAGMRDLIALVDAKAQPALLLLPMVETPTEVRMAANLLGGTALVPLIETPAALRWCARIAAEPAVAMMMFGGGDLSAELGVDLSWEPLATARAMFLLGCAEAAKPTIDVPYVHLADPDGLADETRRARTAGFQAKAAIHPDQVSVINNILRPTDAEVADARAAVAVFDAGGGRAIRFNGRMLEAPVMRRLRRIVAQDDIRGSTNNA